MSYNSMNNINSDNYFNQQQQKSEALMSFQNFQFSEEESQTSIPTQTHSMIFQQQIRNQNIDQEHVYTQQISPQDSQQQQDLDMTINSNATTVLNNNNNNQYTSSLVYIPQNTVLEHLELDGFKTQPCSNNQQHNHKQCKDYHGQKDRRRPGNHYSSEMCTEINSNQGCQYGDNCNKSHNKVEQLYSKDKYKTKFCTFFPDNIINCDYGEYCSFAHTEFDIQVDLIHNYIKDTDFYIFHYKTVWCPYNFIQHDRSQCVYAHNWQDYRRKPQQIKYNSESCQNWDANQFIKQYELGCPKLLKCTYSHGWKESEYHPLNYKTKSCSQQKQCQKGQDCPYYHNQFDKRDISYKVQIGLFKYAQYNRIVYDFNQVLNSNFPKSKPFIQQLRQLQIHQFQQLQTNNFTIQNQNFVQKNQQQQSSNILQQLQNPGKFLFNQQNQQQLNTQAQQERSPTKKKSSIMFQQKQQSEAQQIRQQTQRKSEILTNNQTFLSQNNSQDIFTNLQNASQNNSASNSLNNNEIKNPYPELFSSDVFNTSQQNTPNQNFNMNMQNEQSNYFNNNSYNNNQSYNQNSSNNNNTNNINIQFYQQQNINQNNQQFYNQTSSNTYENNPNFFHNNINSKKSNSVQLDQITSQLMQQSAKRQSEQQQQSSFNLQQLDNQLKDMSLKDINQRRNQRELSQNLGIIEKKGESDSQCDYSKDDSIINQQSDDDGEFFQPISNNSEKNQTNKNENKNENLSNEENDEANENENSKGHDIALGCMDQLGLEQ